MIKSFTCHNYRNIDATDLQFEKINLLIGPNNSGKTNFIRALTFFSQMLANADAGNLRSSFLNSIARNGWNHALNNHADPSDAIDLQWGIDLHGKPVRYNLSFSVGSKLEDCNIVREILSSCHGTEQYDQEFNYFQCHEEEVGTGWFSTAIKKGKPNKRLQVSVSSKETVVRQFKDILLNNTDAYANDTVRIEIASLLYELEQYFERFQVYAGARFDSARIRQPADTKNTDERLKADGTNFTNLFNAYKSRDVLWRKKFEKKMQELIPSLEAADSVLAYDKLIFKMVFESKEYDLSDISEGTLKGLLLNILLNLPADGNNALLAIDEPEINMHPAWQKVIGNWIQTANSYTQCFISTHSPDLLDVFTEAFRNGTVAVFVFRSGEDIKKIKFEDIAEELGDWELGDLYRTSDPALGGWPW